MSKYNELNDAEIRNRFNEEHAKLRDNLEEFSRYVSERKLQWATSVMHPALGVYAELGASDALSDEQRREKLPELVGARKLIVALRGADSDRKHVRLWDSFKLWWKARRQED
jgi:hypothetical protein